MIRSFLTQQWWKTVLILGILLIVNLAWALWGGRALSAASTSREKAAT